MKELILNIETQEKLYNLLDQVKKDIEFEKLYCGINYDAVRYGQIKNEEPNMFIYNKGYHFVPDTKLKMVENLIQKEDIFNNLLNSLSND